MSWEPLGVDDCELFVGPSEACVKHPVPSHVLCGRIVQSLCRWKRPWLYNDDGIELEAACLIVAKGYDSSVVQCPVVLVSAPSPGSPPELQPHWPRLSTDNRHDS